MKIQKRGWPVLIIAFSLMAAGCSLRTTSPGTETTAAETVTGTGTGLSETAASEETEEIQGDKGKDGAGRVAAGEETSSRINVADEDMEPVYAGEIKDGVYPVKVDSSSNMFQVTGCELTVRDGRMTAVMTMGGTGYLKLFMGTGEEAAKAGEEDFIPYRMDFIPFRFRWRRWIWGSTAVHSAKRKRSGMTGFLYSGPILFRPTPLPTGKLRQWKAWRSKTVFIRRR